ncbi:MAG: DUF6794 domain-containing protein [Bacteroidota bacterium]
MDRVSYNIFKTLWFILVLLVFTSCSLSLRAYKSEIDGVYVPQNLDEALAVLDTSFSEFEKDKIRTMNEDDFLGDYHMGTGLWIRNNWGLWSGSRLKRYFDRKGIKHPDDMSGLILTSWFRSISGTDIDLKSQIDDYKSYWREARSLSKLVALPKRSKYPEDSIQCGYAIWYYTGSQNSLVHLQTNSKNDSVWIYEYQYGWKKISESVGGMLKTTNQMDSLLKVIY